MICSIGRLNLTTKQKTQHKELFKSFPHPLSIIKIKQNIKISKKFSFTTVTVETVKNIINALPQNKTVSDDIKLNVFRSSEFTFSYLRECGNEVFQNSKISRVIEVLLHRTIL